MAFPIHADPVRWRREHPRSFRLHRHLPVGDDGTPPAFPRPMAVGRGATADSAYWSSGRVRPGDRCWIFTLTLSGTGCLERAGHRHALPVGSGFLIRLDDPGAVFGFAPDLGTSWEWAWFTFAGTAAEAMAADLLAAHGPVFTLSREDATVRWLRATTAPGRMRGLPPWEARERLWHLLGTLATVTTQADGDPVGRLVAAARRRLIERLTDAGLSVEALATDLGVSREHLGRCFTRVLGITPRRYLEDQRLDLARQLLRETGLGIAAIARQCGWRDAETFRAAWRRRQGRLPSAAR